MIFRKIFLLVALLIIGTPEQAVAAPELGMPLDCALSTDCWTVRYLDTNTAINIAQDFKCGPRTFDAYKGTDFAIRDLLSMEMGVNVLAAASGKVLKFRDGIEDEIPSHEDLNDIKNDQRGCGNGVFLDHGDGWQTVYCHMKKNSIRVTQGQNIKKGEILGQVGHSGLVEFPHVHFGVFFENTAIDPFTGLDDTKNCNTAVKSSLWDAKTNIQYRPLSIYAGGFSTQIPDFEAIKIDASSPANINVSAKALIFWAGIYGAQKGDIITTEIHDPLGLPFARREQTQEETRVRQFYYIGKKTTEIPLTSGTYKGLIQISRNIDDKLTIIDKYELAIPVR